MPLYDFICTNKKCETQVFDIFIASEDVRKGCCCPWCDAKARRLFHLAYFKFDFKEGFDPGLGKYMGTARERDTYADRKNLQRIKD